MVDSSLQGRLRERAEKLDEYDWRTDKELLAATEIGLLVAALDKAIKEADGWCDESRGTPCPGLTKERALLRRLKNA